jgi:hypothetical protein
LCIAVTAGFSVLYVSGALATGTQAEGVYQLDGNALFDLNSNPVMPAANEDADNICAGQHALPGGGTSDGTNAAGQVCNIPSSYPHPPYPAGYALPAGTSSTRFAFVTDGSGNFPSGSSDDVYTGGSKDSNDLSTWVYKDAASSNDKSDIENAFAAFYTATNSDKLVYFGGDRTSNSGDENTAFWFLQNPAIESPCSNITGSGCPFTTDGKALAADNSNAAMHVAANPGPDNCLVPQGQSGMANAGISFTTGLACTGSSVGDSYGDILVVSAFTGGGALPNVTAYEWIGNGFAKGASTQFCGTSSCTTIKILDTTPGCTAAEDTAACAITDQGVATPPSASVPGNPLPTPSPWVYTEKSSDNCTSNSCGANKCTVAANAMCDGIFFEGGLNLTKLGLQSECTSTFVMDTRSSQSVDSSLQDLAVGQVGSCKASLTSKAGDTTDTPENAGTPAPSPTSITTNGTVSSGTDTAGIQVTGASSYTGNITWFICGPFTSQPTTGSGPACDRTKGVPAGSAAVSENPNDQAVHYFVSSSVNLTSAGWYCWTAHFAPTAGQNSQITAQDDNGTNECFHVAPVTPVLKTCSGTYDTSTPPVCTPATPVAIGSTIHDRALLSGLAKEPGNDGASHGGNSNYPTINATNGAYAGTITFTLNGPTAAGASGCGSQTNNSTATPPDSNPQHTSATGTGSVASTGNGVYGPVSYTPGAPGVYHWQATIDNLSSATPPVELSVNNNLPQSENNATCTDTNEDVTVQEHPTTTVTGPVDGSGAPLTTAINGQTSVYDKAVVTDSDGASSPAPTGSVSFWICNPQQTSTDPITSKTVCADGAGSPINPDNSTPPKPTPVTLTVDTAGTPPAATNHSSATSTPGFVPNATGVWCFRATYNPDSTVFDSSHDNSNDECFNVVDVTISTAQTFTVQDRATITPVNGATVGGTVSFQLFPNADCNASGENDVPLVNDTGASAKTLPSGSSAQHADSSAATITSTVQTLSWLVVYTPTGTATAKTGVQSSCHTENSSVTINNG